MIDPNRQLKNGNTLLMTCVLNDQFVVAQSVLQNEGIDLNIQNDQGDTALDLAIKHGKHQFVDFLLEGMEEGDIQKVFRSFVEANKVFDEDQKKVARSFLTANKDPGFVNFLLEGMEEGDIQKVFASFIEAYDDSNEAERKIFISFLTFRKDTEFVGALLWKIKDKAIEKMNASDLNSIFSRMSFPGLGVWLKKFLERNVVFDENQKKVIRSLLASQKSDYLLPNVFHSGRINDDNDIQRMFIAFAEAYDFSNQGEIDDLLAFFNIRADSSHVGRVLGGMKTNDIKSVFDSFLMRNNTFSDKQKKEVSSFLTAKRGFVFVNSLLKGLKKEDIKKVFTAFVEANEVFDDNQKKVIRSFLTDNKDPGFVDFLLERDDKNKVFTSFVGAYDLLDEDERVMLLGFLNDNAGSKFVDLILAEMDAQDIKKLYLTFIEHPYSFSLNKIKTAISFLAAGVDPTLRNTQKDRLYDIIEARDDLKEGFIGELAGEGETQKKANANILSGKRGLGKKSKGWFWAGVVCVIGCGAAIFFGLTPLVVAAAAVGGFCFKKTHDYKEKDRVELEEFGGEIKVFKKNQKIRLDAARHKKDSAKEMEAVAEAGDDQEIESSLQQDPSDSNPQSTGARQEWLEPQEDRDPCENHVLPKR